MLMLNGYKHRKLLSSQRSFLLDRRASLFCFFKSNLQIRCELVNCFFNPGWFFLTSFNAWIKDLSPTSAQLCSSVSYGILPQIGERFPSLVSVNCSRRSHRGPSPPLPPCFSHHLLQDKAILPPFLAPPTDFNYLATFLFACCASA